MSDVLQRVFSIIMATLVFFFLPLYIAFEKMDDIAYSLALSVTSNFVNDVTNKGYITEKMYTDFVSNLSVTGNSYEIRMQHVSKKYNPAILAVDANNNNKYFDFDLYKSKISTVNGEQVLDSNYTKPTLTYKSSEIKYTEKQILGALDSKYYTEVYDISDVDNYQNLSLRDIPLISGLYRINDTTNLYPMNKGDEFTVVVKNTNTSIASVLFNVLTLGANVKNNTKVYINYGGTIENEKYRTTLLQEVKNVEVATGVAQIGSESYNTLQEAIDAVSKTDTKYTTVLLLKDVKESITVKDGRHVRLDLNGNSIISNATETITNEAYLEIDGDGLVEYNGSDKTRKAIININNGNLTVKSGTFKSNGTYQAGWNDVGSTVRIEGGEWIVSDSDAIPFSNDGTAKIIDGSFKGGRYAFVMTQPNAKTEILGGSFESESGFLLSSDNEELDISGGSIKVDNVAIMVGGDFSNEIINVGSQTESILNQRDPKIISSNVGFILKSSILHFNNGSVKVGSDLADNIIKIIVMDGRKMNKSESSNTYYLTYVN